MESKPKPTPAPPQDDTAMKTEMTREEWIAYLAGCETPAYSGWAGNLPRPWRGPTGVEGRRSKAEGGRSLDWPDSTEER